MSMVSSGCSTMPARGVLLLPSSTKIRIVYYEASIHWECYTRGIWFGDCRRKSNRESARRSRVRKLEETHESETAIATLQSSVTAQAKMLSVATEHLETMKVCLSQQEQRVGTLCEGVRYLTLHLDIAAPFMRKVPLSNACFSRSLFPSPCCDKRLL
jgi:hypothetical protein